MFSGSDSAESQGSSTQKYTQWALNPSAYQNIQSEQVDWAALAHQWIKMKEAGPPHLVAASTPHAPPPPIISSTPVATSNHHTHHHRTRHTSSMEGGEAPMDMDESDPPTGGSQWPDWGWNAPTSSTNPWPPTIQTVNKQPLLPTPSAGYTSCSSGSKEEFTSSSSSSNRYWNGPSGKSNSAKVVKPHNKRYSKVNVPIGANKSAPPRSQTPPPPVLDAIKRKQLPAWIREGLEKMERDKLKQMDRSREKVKQEDVEERRKLRENALEILKSSAKLQQMTSISAYDDSNDEDGAGEEGENQTTDKPSTSGSLAAAAPLTHEELMLKVRKIMTDILLKVTDHTIAKICKEELQRHLRKQKATDQHVTAPSEGANLSARLGLDAYDDNSEASNDEEDNEHNERTNEESDDELRETIRRRKESFAIVEQEIETRLAQVEKVQKSKTSPTRAITPPTRTQDHRSPVNSKPASGKRKPSSSTIVKRQSRSRSRFRSRSRSRSSSTSSSSSSPVSRRRRRRSRSPRKRCRKYSRSRSRSRSKSNYRRRYSRRSRTRSRTRSPAPPRRRRRSRTRSKSRSYDSGRGKRFHRH